MNTYKSKLDLLETQIAIKFVKDTFEAELAKALNIIRVSAPLFVYSTSGLNDYLSGFERPVSFKALEFDTEIEIVQSLAKWKRMALKKYNISSGNGLYTDMNAIRRDESTDAIHSLYVDQWDWEKVLTKDMIGNLGGKIEEIKEVRIPFSDVVRKIYSVIYKVGLMVEEKYTILESNLPKDIFIISSEELLKMYPNLTGKERENKITKEHGAVFIYGIGWPLSNNEPHDSRAPDYDDWKLNGDILVWDEELNIALELSSMGIRVDSSSIYEQVMYKSKNLDHKLDNNYAQMVLNNELPLTIGGGIGQSRLCMFFLKKKHIGEVQVSIWKEEEIEKLKNENIILL